MTYILRINFGPYQGATIPEQAPFQYRNGTYTAPDRIYLKPFRVNLTSLRQASA